MQNIYVTVSSAATSFIINYLAQRWSSNKIILHYHYIAGPSSRSVEGVGLRPRACWDCGFESHRRHGRLSVVSVVCCQVEVSATNWSLLRRSPTYCGASLCVIYKPRKRRIKPAKVLWIQTHNGLWRREKKMTIILAYHFHRRQGDMT